MDEPPPTEALDQLRHDFCVFAAKVSSGAVACPPTGKVYDNSESLNLVLAWLEQENLLFSHSMLLTETAPFDVDSDVAMTSKDASNESETQSHTERLLRGMLEKNGFSRAVRANLLRVKYAQLLRQAQSTGRVPNDDRVFPIATGIVQAWLEKNGLQQTLEVFEQELEVEFNMQLFSYGDNAMLDLDELVSHYRKDVGLTPEVLEELLS